jgi:hypothetical protein
MRLARGATLARVKQAGRASGMMHHGKRPVKVYCALTWPDLWMARRMGGRRLESVYKYIAT